MKERLPKNHVGYWKGRLTHRSWKRADGSVVELPEFYIRIRMGNHAEWFNLGTAREAEAATKARDIYESLRVVGWTATLAKFKPQEATTKISNLTIGEFVEEVRKLAKHTPNCLRCYEQSLFQIGGQCFGVKVTNARFGKSDGSQSYRERVGAIRLAKLTPERVTAWARGRVLAAGKSPLAIATARRTVNGHLGRLSSLFKSDVLKELKHLDLPAKLPHQGVERMPNGSTKYVSKIKIEPIIAAARLELKPKRPELYKVFLLALFGGLRRGEIDKLEWKMVDFSACKISLSDTEYLHLKTVSSAAVVELDAEVSAELRDMVTGSKGQFVVQSGGAPDSGCTYRCEQVFDDLIAWLRAKGVTAQKPIHELRKEIGAVIATRDGILAASQFLRHSDLTTTARHYAVHKHRISAGIGSMLLPAQTKTPATKHEKDPSVIPALVAG